MKKNSTMKQGVFTLALLATAWVGNGQNVLSRQQTLNTLPATSIDLHRVQNGFFSHQGNPAGGMGTFAATDKWMLFGAPAVLVNPLFYGERIQWNGQGYNRILRERTPGGIKDALLEWGGQAGSEFQLRFLPNSSNPAVFNRQFTMLTNGNSYFGATPMGFGGRVEINTTNQLGIGVNTTANRAGLLITANNIAGNFSFGVHGIARAQAANTTNWGVAGVIDNFAGINTATNYGVAGYVFGSNLNNRPNYGVFGQAPVASNAPGTVNTSYAGFFQGDVYCSGMYYGSDGKYKKNVVNESGVLAKIVDPRVRPVLYEFDNATYPELNFTNKQQHGFLAEELELVFPEVVQRVQFIIRDGELNEKGTDEGLAVNYTGLISILFQAVKEQQVQIEDLKKAIGLAKTTLKTADEEAIAGKTASTENNNANGVLLSQNSPNPFTSVTSIKYNVPEKEGLGAIDVFDANGNLLVQYNNLKGAGQVEIQGNRLQPGTYIYSLKVNNKEVLSRKMLLTR